MDLDAATRTMIDNIPARTGRSLDDWFTVLDAADLPQHGKAMALLKGEHGMTHGFANLIVTLHRQRGTEATSDDLVDAQYAGPKAALRPLCDQLIAAASSFGSDVEVAPKKTVGLPAAGQAVRRHRGAQPHPDRAGPQPARPRSDGRLLVAGGMCTHRVDLPHWRRSTPSYWAGSGRRTTAPADPHEGTSSSGTKLAAAGPNSTTRRRYSVGVQPLKRRNARITCAWS